MKRSGFRSFRGGRGAALEIPGPLCKERKEMPIYEFKCEKCGKKLEDLRKVGDFEPPLCGDCGSEMKMVFSKTGIFEFKGPGFHATDYPKPYDDMKGVAGKDE